MTITTREAHKLQWVIRYKYPEGWILNQKGRFSASQAWEFTITEFVKHECRCCSFRPKLYRTARGWRKLSVWLL